MNELKKLADYLKFELFCRDAELSHIAGTKNNKFDYDSNEHKSKKELFYIGTVCGSRIQITIILDEIEKRLKKIEELEKEELQNYSRMDF